VLATSSARADDAKLACIAAHTEGQELRNAGNPVAARARFAICANPSCPAMVRTECTQLGKQLDDALPTLLIEARSPDGAGVTAVRMFVDGVSVLDELTRLPIKIAPGEHLLRFVPADPQLGEREVKIAPREGEKNIILVLDLPRRVRHDGGVDGNGAVVASPRAPVTQSPYEPVRRGTDGDTRSAHGGGVSTTGIVLLGLSAGSLIAFGAFALKGRSEERELAGCAPRCAASDVDRMYRDYLIADVALGVGVLAGGIGGWLVIASLGSPAKPSATVRLAPLGLGGVVSTVF
jgi:hypothetical protein